DLGNLLQRTVSMIHRYRDGVVTTPAALPASSLQAMARELPATLHRALTDGWDPRAALSAIFSLVGSANRFIEDTKPWALSRAEHEGNADSGREIDVVLWQLAECLRRVAEALRPLLPE